MVVHNTQCTLFYQKLFKNILAYFDNNFGEKGRIEMGLFEITLITVFFFLSWNWPLSRIDSQDGSGELPVMI